MNKKVRKIIEEAIWEARVNDWLIRRECKEYMELADVEKTIANIFETKSMKNYLALTELENETK